MNSRESVRIEIRRCTPEEFDELRSIAHPEWKIPHDTINVPNPPHYKCKAHKVPCFIKKETPEYWEVIELWGVYVRYMKHANLFTLNEYV
jgi:hypothetical protein